MTFMRDDDLQFKLEKSSGMIHIFAYDRSTKEKVRIGHVQGRQHYNKDNEWVSDRPDDFEATKVREMLNQTLKNVAELT